jgi:hypothetical protein
MPACAELTDKQTQTPQLSKFCRKLREGKHYGKRKRRVTGVEREF